MESPSDRIDKISRIIKKDCPSEHQNKWDSEGRDYEDMLIGDLESILNKETSYLGEVTRILEINKSILNQFLNITLIISVLSLVAVSLWFYQSISSSSYAALLLSAAFLALLNILVSLRIKKMLS